MKKKRAPASSSKRGRKAQAPSDNSGLPSDWTDEEQICKRRRLAFMKHSLLKSPVNHVRIPDAPPCMTVNVVTTFHLGIQKLSLHDIAHRFRRCYTAKYQPQQFAAMLQMVRIPHSKEVRALLFASGAVVLTGADSKDVALATAHALVAFYRKPCAPGGLGMRDVQVNDLRYRNMVARFDFGFSVDLHVLQEEFGARAVYKHWVIQCCRIRNAQNRKTVVLVFATGCGIVTGVKTHNEIIENVREVYQTVVRLRAQKKTATAEVPLLKGTPAYATVADTERAQRQQSTIARFEAMMDQSQHLLGAQQSRFIRTEHALATPGSINPFQLTLNPFGSTETELAALPANEPLALEAPPEEPPEDHWFEEALVIDEFMQHEGLHHSVVPLEEL